MKRVANIFIFLFLFSQIAVSQAREGTGFLDKGKQQVTFSLSDMSSAEAYGAQVHFRYGYFVMNKLELGLDVNGGVRNYDIAYGSFGPFVKYHVLDNWFSPFVVASTDFGLCDFNDTRTNHYMKGKLSWGKYFVGGGFGFYGLKEHWGFETAIGYQHENYLRKDDGAPDATIQQWTIPIKWRISYSF